MFPHPISLPINLGTKKKHIPHDDQFRRFTKSPLCFISFHFSLLCYVPFINADPKNLALYCVEKRWKGVPNQYDSSGRTTVVFLLSGCSVSNSATMVCFGDGSAAKQPTIPAVVKAQPDSVIVRLKRDGTRAETRFRLSPKRTSPFKSAGALVQSTAGSRGVRISVSNAG